MCTPVQTATSGPILAAIFRGKVQPSDRRTTNLLPMTFRRLLTLAALCGLTVAACATRATEESAVRRGDQAFALGNYEEALAEYRLAVRQGADDAGTMVRVAHTYAIMGRVDDAGAYYVEAASKEEGLADQAVADLMRLARESLAKGDRFAMATAVSGSPVEKPTYLPLRCAASMIFVTAASTFGSKLSYGAVGSRIARGQIIIACRHERERYRERERT